MEEICRCGHHWKDHHESKFLADSFEKNDGTGCRSCKCVWYERDFLKSKEHSAKNSA